MIDRARILARTGGKCAYCGCDLAGTRWQVDHYHPRMQPVKKKHHITGREYTTTSHDHSVDTERAENLLPSCQSCNVVKSSMTIERFRETIANFIVGFKRDYPKYRLCKRFGLIEETGKEVQFEFEKQGIRMPELAELKEDTHD